MTVPAENRRHEKGGRCVTTVSRNRPKVTRRVLGLGMAAFLSPPALARKRDDVSPIAQPATADARAFIARAVAMKAMAESAGDQGFGAVVVKDGVIVGEAPSRVVTNDDPTAHAELEALRDAARRVGRRKLAGAQLYSTFRPCPMCEAAAAWANVARMFHGEAITDAGAPQLRR